MSEIEFQTAPSNNHASPSGVLPFLQPAVSESTSEKVPEPVAGTKLKKWIASQQTTGEVPEAGDVRREAYESLLNNNLRKAWVCTSHPQQFEGKRSQVSSSTNSTSTPLTLLFFTASTSLPAPQTHSSNGQSRISSVKQPKAKS